MRFRYHMGDELNLNHLEYQRGMAGWVVVSVCCMERPTVQDLVDWLEDRGGVVDLRSHEVGTMAFPNGSLTISQLFQASFYLSDPGELLVFKLTWGGR